MTRVAMQISKRKLEKYICLGLLAIFSSGCISALNARNYVPQDCVIDSQYNDCVRASQRSYSGGSSCAGTAAGSYAGGAGTVAGSSACSSYGPGVGTDVTVLKACMGARGYHKREYTTGEAVLVYSTAIIWVPLCFGPLFPICALAAMGS
jgi:hypothetical protein